jgi:predicted Zn-dependent protease
MMRFDFRKSVASVLCSTLMLSTVLSPAAYADGLNNLPSLGDAGGAELSVQDERRLGALIMKDYRAFGAVNTDPEITAYITRLGNKIVQGRFGVPIQLRILLGHRQISERFCNARWLHRHTHRFDCCLAN